MDARSNLRPIIKRKLNPVIAYDLKYYPVEPLKFMAKDKNSKIFKFGHLFRHNGNFKIVTASLKNKPWVLKVESIRVMVEY